jgi:hypothetical protein
MRRIQRSFRIFCLLSVALGAPTAAVAQGQGACAQIRAACQSAGFVQGAANLGIGLQLDCVAPIMRGTAQRARARKPLPQVDSQLIAQCANSHPRFGRPNVLRAELQPPGVSPPPPGSTHLNNSPPWELRKRQPGPASSCRRWASSADTERSRRARHHFSFAAGGSARNRSDQVVAAVSPNGGELPNQGTRRHNHRRYPQHVSLLRAGRWQGDALRHRRGPRGFHLGRNRAHFPNFGVA